MESYLTVGYVITALLISAVIQILVARFDWLDDDADSLVLFIFLPLLWLPLLTCVVFYVLCLSPYHLTRWIKSRKQPTTGASAPSGEVGSDDSTEARRDA